MKTLRNLSLLAIGVLAGACVSAGSDIDRLEREDADGEHNAVPHATDSLAAETGPTAQTPGFDMSITAAGDDLTLDFDPQSGATLYTLWSSADPYFEPGDPGSNAVVTGSADDFTVTDGAIGTDSLYWRVTDDAGATSTTVGRFVQGIGPAINLLGFPLIDTGILNAQDLAAHNPSFSQVIVYDGDFGDYGSYMYWASPADPNLYWPATASVVVENTGGAEYFRQFGHVPVDADIATELTDYATLLTLPLSMEAMTASQIAAVFPDALAVNTWDYNTQATLSYVTDSGWGPDFTVQPGGGFMLYLGTDQSFQWPPGYEPTPVCGNGIVDEGEQCDDGNDVAEDGCESTCLESGIAGLTSGQYFNCALTHGGNVKCWGNNTLGQLGYGNTENIGDNELPSSVGFVDLGEPALEVEAGNSHTCALLQSNAVKCWGQGNTGLLGNGSLDHVGDDEIPAQAPNVDLGDLGGAQIVEIEVGQHFSCALLDDGTLRCWGRNQYFVFTDPALANTEIVGDDEPAAQPDVGGFVTQISVGQNSICALLDTQQVRCWGYWAHHGHLGSINGNIGDDETPAQTGFTLPIGPVAEIRSGAIQHCAILDDGQLYCWGGNYTSETGYPAGAPSWAHAIGTVDPLDTEGPVDIGGPVTDVFPQFLRTCARRDNGEIVCWGENSAGLLALGHSSDVGLSQTPAEHNSVLDASQDIATMATATLNHGHTCVLMNSGNVRCWGVDAFGSLGAGAGLAHTYYGDNPGETAANAPDVQLF